LQIALSALVANWAVQRVVGQQKLHDTSSGNPGLLTLGNDFEVWSDIGGTSSQWLGSPLDLDQAHSAVSSHGQSLVIAKSWDFDSGLGAGLEDGVRGIDRHRLSVDIHIEVVVKGLRRSEKSLRGFDQGFFALFGSLEK